MTWVAVTGGSGKLGRAVVADLVDHGYEVVNLDRVAVAGRRAPCTSRSTSPTTARPSRRCTPSTTATPASTRSCTWPRSPRPA